MIFAERDFIPVMLGNDINVYSLARAFYEAYHIKSIACGKAKSGPACHSNIIDYQAIENLDHPETFIQVLNGLAGRLAHKKLILLGCGDNYVEQIIRNRAQLRENIIAPYVDEDMMDALITKESFYEMCDRYWLEYPKTFLYTRDMGEDFDLPFGFPIILKPSNGVNYWAHSFASQKKVYKLDNRQDLLKVIDEIYQAGYEDKLIIQDFIPGDDSCMYAMNSFSGRDKKVRLMALGHVILEEHTPHGLGNAAVIISDYDEQLSLKIKDFLENIGYEGFASFDIKYDRRDGRLKILEINLRQGRGSYYVTAAGSNLAEYVTEEYIFNQPGDFKIVQNEILWTAIPLQTALMVIKDHECRAKMKRLIKNRKAINPLFLKGDLRWERARFLYRSHLSHYYKFLRYYR